MRTRDTVAVTAAVTAVLHVPWALWLANGGGDLAAQTFWSGAVDRFPGSAYNFATYGGMHIATYSLVSPYLLAWGGVRLVTAVAAVAAAALTALIAARLGVRRAWIPGVVAAVTLTGNSWAGRSTFAIGLVFALGAVALAFPLPARVGWRGAGVAVGSALATLGSPVAGLFLGLLAAAVWLTGAPGSGPDADELGQGARPRHRARAVAAWLATPHRLIAYCLGAPAVVVVLGTAAWFPFHGEQPMGWPSVLAPAGLGVVTFLVAPRGWPTARALGAVYAVAVVGVWLVPSPIGTNITRLGLLFSAVLLTAAVCSGRARRVALATLGAAGGLAWAIAVPILDAVRTHPDPIWDAAVDELVTELNRRGADLTRIEVIPAASHLDTAELAPRFTLARGWNRQADLSRHPMFYGRSPLDADTYRAWLDRWAVHYVVVAPGRIDAHAGTEADLVAGGLPALDLVWSEHGWQLFAVADPTPLVSPPAELVAIDPAHVTVRVPAAGEVTIRMLHSPWLGVIDAEGNLIRDGSACITGDSTPGTGSGRGDDAWTVLRVERPGDYTVAAPYALPRGSPCPTE